MGTNLGYRLSLRQKIRLFLFGYTPTKIRTRPGWEGEILFYAFNCPVHGLVEDYPHGFTSILRCPLCSKILEDRQIIKNKNS